MAADLITNRPAGVIRATGLVVVEQGTFRLRRRFLTDGVPFDFTGHSVDSAQIDTGIPGAGLISLNVTLNDGGTGIVKIEGNLAQMTPGLVSSVAWPDGRPATLYVRLKDPSTFPYYLIAPSQILIKNAPGAST